MTQYKLLKEDLFLYLLEEDKEQEKDPNEEISGRIDNAVAEILSSPYTSKIYELLKEKNFEDKVVNPIKTYLNRINVGNVTTLVDLARKANKLGVLGKIGLFFLIISSFIVKALEGFVKTYERVVKGLESKNSEKVEEELRRELQLSILSEGLLDKIAKAISFIRLFFKIRNKSTVLGNYLAISLFKRPFTTLFMLMNLLFLQIFSFKMATMLLRKAASKSENGAEIIKKLDDMENKYSADKDDLPRNKLLIAIKNILKMIPSTLITSIGLTFTKIRDFFTKKFEEEVGIEKDEKEVEESYNLREEVILREFFGANILKLGAFSALIVVGLKFIMDFIKDALKINNPSFEAIHKFINTYYNKTSRKIQQFLVKLKLLDEKVLEKTQA